MLTCKEVSQLLSTDAVADKKLSDRLRVKLHLFMCKHCREYAAQLRVMSVAGRSIAHDCSEDQEQLHRLEKVILEQIDEPGRSDPGSG